MLRKLALIFCNLHKDLKVDIVFSIVSLGKVDIYVWRHCCYYRSYRYHHHHVVAHGYLIREPAGPAFKTLHMGCGPLLLMLSMTSMIFHILLFQLPHLMRDQYRPFLLNWRVKFPKIITCSTLHFQPNLRAIIKKERILQFHTCSNYHHRLEILGANIWMVAPKDVQVM